MAHEILDSAVAGTLAERVDAAAALLGEALDRNAPLSEEDISIMQTTLWDVRRALRGESYLDRRAMVEP